LVVKMAQDPLNLTKQAILDHRMSRHNSAWRVSESSSARARTDTMTTDAHQFRRDTENISNSANSEVEATMMTVMDSSINTYKAGQTILDIVAGQTVGTLAWIHDEDYASPFELRATSTSVEVYCIPISVIRESPKIREAMMTSAGRTIAFQVFTNNTDPSPFWHWSSRAIKKHLATWKVIRPGANVVDDTAAELPSDPLLSMEANPSNESLGISEEERERQPLVAHSESKQQHANSTIETGSVADTGHEWFLCNFIQHVVLVRGEIIKVEIADSSHAAKLAPSYSRSEMQGLISEDVEKSAKTGHKAMHVHSAPMSLVPSAEAVAHLDDKSMVYFIHVDAWLCLPDRAEFHLVDNMEDLKLEWDELTGVDLNNDFRNLLAGNTQDVIKLQRVLKIWKRSMSAADVLSRKRVMSAAAILSRKRSQSASTTPSESSASPGNDSGILPPTPELLPTMPKLVLNEDAGDLERVMPVTPASRSLFGPADDTGNLFDFSSTRDSTSISRRETHSPLPGQLA